MAGPLDTMNIILFGTYVVAPILVIASVVALIRWLARLYRDVRKYSR